MKRIALEGHAFGRLIVEQQAGGLSGATAYRCKCLCGRVVVVRGQSLRKGETTSCGCARADLMREKQTRHGMYGTPTYNSWSAMWTRCTSTKHKQFNDYGGRGITVCDAWQSFDEFLKDMGERPAGRTIDRIDNDKGYSGGNCRWATRAEQARNKRTTRI